MTSVLIRWSKTRPLAYLSVSYIHVTVVITYLNIIFDEARCLDASLYVETYIHLYVSLLVSQFNNRHLSRTENCTCNSKSGSRVSLFTVKRAKRLHGRVCHLSRKQMENSHCVPRSVIRYSKPAGLFQAYEWFRHSTTYICIARRDEKRVTVVTTHRSLVQHFDGERFGHIMLAKSLFQLLQRGTLPLPKDHQVNVTEGPPQ